MSTWRAVITLVAGIAVLGTIALPATQMRLGLPSGSSEATDSAQYKAYKTLEQEFGAGQNGPLLGWPASTCGFVVRGGSKLPLFVESKTESGSQLPHSKEDTMLLQYMNSEDGIRPSETASHIRSSDRKPFRRNANLG